MRTQHGVGQWRAEADQPARGIGFVHADDAEGLLAAFAGDGDFAAERHRVAG